MANYEKFKKMKGLYSQLGDLMKEYEGEFGSSHEESEDKEPQTDPMMGEVVGEDSKDVDDDCCGGEQKGSKKKSFGMLSAMLKAGLEKKGKKY